MRVLYFLFLFFCIVSPSTRAYSTETNPIENYLVPIATQYKALALKSTWLNGRGFLLEDSGQIYLITSSHMTHGMAIHLGGLEATDSRRDIFYDIEAFKVSSSGRYKVLAKKQNNEWVINPEITSLLNLHVITMSETFFTNLGLPEPTSRSIFEVSPDYFVLLGKWMNKVTSFKDGTSYGELKFNALRSEWISPRRISPGMSGSPLVRRVWTPKLESKIELLGVSNRYSFNSATGFFTDVSVINTLIDTMLFSKASDIEIGSKRDKLILQNGWKIHNGITYRFFADGRQELVPDFSVAGNGGGSDGGNGGGSDGGNGGGSDGGNGGGSDGGNGGGSDGGNGVFTYSKLKDLKILPGILDPNHSIVYTVTSPNGQTGELLADLTSSKLKSVHTEYNWSSINTQSDLIKILNTRIQRSNPFLNSTSSDEIIIDIRAMGSDIRFSLIDVLKNGFWFEFTTSDKKYITINLSELFGMNLEHNAITKETTLVDLLKRSNQLKIHLSYRPQIPIRYYPKIVYADEQNISMTLKVIKKDNKIILTEETIQ